MKILHVIHSLDPRSGGPTAGLRPTVRGQVDAGHDVALLATDIQSGAPWEPATIYTQRMRDDPAWRGADVYLGRAYGRRKPWSTYGYSPACRRWLRRRLADPQRAPEIVHVHGVFSHLTAAAMAAARAAGVPYVLDPAGSLSGLCYRSGRTWLKRLFSRLWLRRDVRHAAVVEAMTPIEREEILEYLSDARAMVRPLGMDPAPDDLEPARQRFLAAFPQLRGRRIVLYLSRIDRKKRLEILVEACGLACRDVPELTLVVAGQDAGHQPVVEEAIARLGLADRVVFAGFLQGDAKQGALAAAGLFALPSDHENFGVAVIEALAHGLPTLVAPGVASHLHVDASGCGLTVPNRPEEFARGIRTLLAADRQEMGARGRRYVAANLGWPRVLAQLDDLYRAAIARSRPGSRT